MPARYMYSPSALNSDGQRYAIPIWKFRHWRKDHLVEPATRARVSSAKCRGCRWRRPPQSTFERSCAKTLFTSYKLRSTLIKSTDEYFIQGPFLPVTCSGLFSTLFAVCEQLAYRLWQLNCPHTHVHTFNPPIGQCLLQTPPSACASESGFMKAGAHLPTYRSSPKDAAAVYVQCLGLRPTRPLPEGGNVQFM